jgi:hypothetical protein
MYRTLMKIKVLLCAMSVQKLSIPKQQSLDIGHILIFLVQPKTRHWEENDII